MRRTKVGLMAGKLCALVAENGGIQKVVARKRGDVLEGRNGRAKGRSARRRRRISEAARGRL